ncbi:MAG: hypothetical protein QGH39_10095, partial [Candidatus Thermoplasmatota archaeon]|nr:hypothetical protein [Candidatus Thermoplasmatota archaeon]
ISLGMNFKNNIMSRPPFHVFCDDDPIDDRSRLMVVYTATDCRKTRFPDDTSVLMYFPDYSEDKFDQPLEALAVIHGNYFDDRSDFPLKVNVSLEDYDIAGESLITLIPMRTRRKQTTNVEIMRYPDNISIIAIDVGGKKLIGGFVLGKMPESMEAESWRSILKVYRSFAPDKIKAFFKK